jgi:hypothetical protein
MGLAITVLFFFVCYQKAYSSTKICAYIDPGTGSLVIQVIIGVLCGGLFMIKLFWKKIKMLFANLFSGDRKSGKAGA